MLSIKASARALGLSERTVRRHVAAGRIPCVRFGRTVRIPVGALDSCR
ncbi:MAG: helix-turn-helix domain-containing protein [Acidimicrobiales bacterium]